MKHYVYLMNGSEKKLIYVEKDSESGNIFYSIDYQQDPPLEKITQYLDGLVIEEKNIENNVEIARNVYEYDYQKRRVSHKRYLQEYLAEELHTEYVENTTITSRIENGIVIERSIEKEFDDGTKITEYYDFGELFEIQEETYVFDTNTYLIRVLNVDRELVSTISEQVDDYGRILNNHEIGADGKTISEAIYLYETDQLSQITFTDHVAGKTELHRYSYDEYGNETEFMVKDEKGNVIAFNTSVYDEGGIVIEEKGISSGTSTVVTSTYIRPDTKEYYLVHEYKE